RHPARRVREGRTSIGGLLEGRTIAFDVEDARVPRIDGHLAAISAVDVVPGLRTARVRISDDAVILRAPEVRPAVRIRRSRVELSNAIPVDQSRPGSSGVALRT